MYTSTFSQNTIINEAPNNKCDLMALESFQRYHVLVVIAWKTYFFFHIEQSTLLDRYGQGIEFIFRNQNYIQRLMYNKNHEILKLIR